MMKKSSKGDKILTFPGAISYLGKHHPNAGRKRSDKERFKKKRDICSVDNGSNLRGVDVDGIFLYAMAASDQFYDTTNIAANIVDPDRGESILHVPSDELFFTHTDDLKIVRIICFEVMLGSRGRAVQFILQRLGNFYTHEQSLIHLNHSSLLLLFFLRSFAVL
jgi:hypothetical protein